MLSPASPRTASAAPLAGRGAPAWPAVRVSLRIYRARGPWLRAGAARRCSIHGAGHCTDGSDPIEVEATVTTALPNAMFKLRLDNSEHEILGIVSGKMRKHFIRILPGDRVKVQLSPYDLTKGRIVFRQK